MLQKISVIDTAMEKLNTAFQAASQDMYQASNQDGGPDLIKNQMLVG